jgi:hypothetical protein
MQANLTLHVRLSPDYYNLQPIESLTNLFARLKIYSSSLLLFFFYYSQSSLSKPFQTKSLNQANLISTLDKVFSEVCQ